MKIIRMIFIFLAIIGLGISSYLTYTHYTNTAVFCEIEPKKDNNVKVFKIENIKKQNSCDKVLQSSYSEIFGIPMSIFGVMFYLGVLTIFILFLLNKFKYNKEILVLFTFIGACFSLYFSYLQHFVIKGFCYYCYSSAIITYILFGLSLYFYKKKGQK